jgi:hypothetical protein
MNLINSTLDIMTKKIVKIDIKTIILIRQEERAGVEMVTFQS